ncbi:MAG TPA: DNA repair protein RadA, partial [Desulfoprunum sp.]|nr:DNA repair protein RadA [Desulfoprunum sp.]
SLRERPLSSATVVCGEVGLAGEIRAVGQIDIRLREAERLGFTRFIMPRSNRERCSRSGQIETVGVANLHELLEIIFE